ncbi:hypothetical protein FAIPA1_730002 [Frankia sp. AiPs1]
MVVYLLLAAALFPGIGYPLVWAKLTGGLEGLGVASPTGAALAQARRRLGPVGRVGRVRDPDRRRRGVRADGQRGDGLRGRAGPVVAGRDDPAG